LLINRCNPEKILLELNKIVAKTKSLKFTNFLIINKSTGLISTGNLEETINLLRDVDLQSLHLPSPYFITITC